MSLLKRRLLYQKVKSKGQIMTKKREVSPNLAQNHPRRGIFRQHSVLSDKLLGVYTFFKVATFAFVDPELIRERAAPGPGIDRGNVVLATLGYLGLYPGTFVAAGLDAVRFGPDA
jgi:hypothetical protein